MAEANTAPKLPYDVDIEQALLGAVLCDNSLIDDASTQLAADDFYDPLHQRLWANLCTLRSQRQRVDPLTLRATLINDEGFEEVGGIAYLKSLARAAPAMPNLPDYCRILRDLDTKRALIQFGDGLAYKASHWAIPAEEILAEHEIELRALAEGRPEPDEPKSWYDAGCLALDSDPNTIAVPLLPYGIPELDAEIGGMGPGDVIILAGRPGMGKSAVALHIAHSVSRPKRQLSLELSGDDTPIPGVGVFFASLEMTKTEIVHRGLSMRAYAQGDKIPYKFIRQKKLLPAQESTLAGVLNEDNALPLIIDDKGGQSVGALGVRMRRAQNRLKREGRKLGLAIIDHLQLIEGEGRSDNRVGELTRITKSLKAMAKSLGIPLLVLCQLSREVEKRDDKKPQISDLRESGSIEQDADVVILIHRPEFYLANDEPKEGAKDMAEWESKMVKARGKLHMGVPKNRHGAPASVTVDCSIAHNWIGAL